MARFRAYSSDSDDDDQSSYQEVEREVREVSESPSSRPPSTPRRHSFVSQQDSEEEVYDHVGIEVDEEDQDTVTVDPSLTPWARELGVNPQKMHVMQTSLFRVPEEAEAMLAAEDEVPLRPRRKRMTLNRKHSRDSEGDGLRADSRQRASFAHDVDLAPFRPSRKYARVETAASIVAGHEDVLIDYGLALGRSFRVGWGPGGRLAHLGSLCTPHGAPKVTANTSKVHITIAPTLPLKENTTLEEEEDRISKLLSHNLSNTLIEPDADGVPLATPSRKLTFGSFASLFPSTNRSFEASLFRLGHALFDPIDVCLASSVNEDVHARATVLRRKAELSRWLVAAVAPSVERDIREAGDGDWAAGIFALLSGYRIEKACEAALDSANPKLATLIAQASGDHAFKEDLRAQLAVWREQRIDVHIGESIRKIYGLLGGIVDVVEGSKGTGLERCPDVHVTQGLDWKRTFGLHLWFGQPLDASISDVFEAYNTAVQEGKTSQSSSIAPPVPWYTEGPSAPFSQWNLRAGAEPPDSLFSLIKLFADSSTSLSEILSPLSYSPSPVDSRLPWHLYILMSRCLRVRDFTDRGDPGLPPNGEDDTTSEPEVEGHSPSADLLASSFASQLEEMGMLQEAVFVLLHVEGSVGRRRAIKDMLSRNASKLDEWMTRGLVGSLKIPMSWVNEVKATYAFDQGKVFEAYELYLAAGLYNLAHEIAVLELAPDAVIRHDLELLKELFRKIAGHPVDGWQEGGKAFLDYAHAITRLPELRERLDDMPHPSEGLGVEVEELTRSVPKLIGVLSDALRDRSDVRHKAALAEMISGLTSRLDQLRPLALGSQLRTANIAESTKLHHIRATAYEKFLRTIEVA